MHRFTHVVSGAVMAVTAVLGPRLLASQAPPRSPRDSLAALVTRLVALSDSGNFELRSMRRALVHAEAQRNAAGRRPALTLGIDFADGPDLDPADGNVTVEVGSVLWQGRRRSAARSRGSVEVDAARRDLEAHETLLRPRLIGSLAAYVGASRSLEQLRRGEALLADLEASLRDRFSVGDARYVDLLRVRTERARASAAQSQLIAAQAAARARIQLLVGDSPAASVAALVDGAAAPSLNDAWVALVTAEVGDTAVVSDAVRSASAAVERAEAERAVVQAEQRTSMSGSVGVQRISPFNGGETLGLTASAQTTLPFTARAAREASLGAADVAVTLAQARLSQARAELAIARTQAQAALAAAVARVRTFNQSVLQSAQAERASALDHYRAGTLTLVELLDFERALLEAEAEHADAIRDAAFARLSVLSGESIDNEID